MAPFESKGCLIDLQCFSSSQTLYASARNRPLAAHEEMFYLIFRSEFDSAAIIAELQQVNPALAFKVFCNAHVLMFSDWLAEGSDV